MRKLLAFLAVVAITACDTRVGSSFVAPQTPSIVGAFKLRTFNGLPLPAVADANATDTLKIIGDTLTFSSDKSLRRAYAVTITTPPGPAVPSLTVSTGSYTSTSGDVTITLPIGSTTYTVPGTLSSSTLTLNDRGDIWVYQK